MGKDILYSFAKDEKGALVKAGAAQRGGSFYCPSCHKEMVHRMGERVRPHFAHKNLSQNCSPETVLHFGFKKLLHERITKSLQAGEQLLMQWKCEACSGSHMGNLVKRTSRAEEEFNLGACRPDIGLIGKEGNIVAVIEIVVSHSPEQSKLELYKAKGIPLLVFKLKSDAELSRVEEDVLKPDIVDVCLNPRCPKCNEHMPRLKLLIIDGKCWRCSLPMKVGALDGDAGYECKFSTEHVALANRHGANITERYSKKAGQKYFANTCKRCNAFIGEHYLFPEYVAADEYPRIDLDAGYYCPGCCSDPDGNSFFEY